MNRFKPSRPGSSTHVVHSENVRGHVPCKSFLQQTETAHYYQRGVTVPYILLVTVGSTLSSSLLRALFPAFPPLPEPAPAVSF